VFHHLVIDVRVKTFESNDECNKLLNLLTVFHHLVIDVRVKTFESNDECNKLLNLSCTF
jgi:hypothetical protein